MEEPGSTSRQYSRALKEEQTPRKGKNLDAARDFVLKITETPYTFVMLLCASRVFCVKLLSRKSVRSISNTDKHILNSNVSLSRQ